MPLDGWQRLALALDALQQPALDIRSVGPRAADAGWEESKHTRKHGQFAPKGQGALGAAKTAPVHETQTPEFKNWFGRSHVRDESGAPRVMYHGTKGDIGSAFRPELRGSHTGSGGAEQAFFFTSKPTVAESYAEKAPRQDFLQEIDRLSRERATLKAERDQKLEEFSAQELWPAGATETLEDYDYRMQDRDFALGQLASYKAAPTSGFNSVEYLMERHLGAETAKRLSQSGGEAVYPVYVKAENPLVVNAEGKVWHELPKPMSQSIAEAAAAGHDSVIFKDIYDPLQSYMGEKGRSDVVAVFDPTHIKSAVGNKGTFDPKSPVVTDAGWEESAHPRGQPENKGEFSKGGGGGASAIQAPAAPDIPDEVKRNKQFAPFFERGALEPRTRTNSYGKQELEFHPHPSANVQAFHAGREDQPDKVAYYDPRFAELQTLNEDDPIIARKIAVPKEGVETEFHPPADENAIYRGISAEEYAAIQQTGEVRSKGEFNIGPEQEGLTYWTKDPSMANSYANSFAPAAMKPTPDRPAYIVATQMPQETKRVQGTGAAEVGVARPIKREEITGIWRGDPIEYTPGNYSMPDQFGGGGVSGVAPSATLRWSRIDQQAHDMALDIRAVGPRRLGQDKFDPSEPRDPTGEWTTGGGSGKAAASPKSKPEEPSPGPAATKAKPPSGSKRGDKARDAHQARVQHILYEGYHGNWEPSPEKVKTMLSDITDVVYDYMGVDKKDVPFTVGPTHEFTVGDRKFVSGGFYTPSKKSVVIGDNNHPTQVGQLSAHEIMHAKYDALMEAYREEGDRISKDNRGGDKWIMRPSGEIREEYQADYPIHTAMPYGFGGKLDDLEKDDGITDYSREWWQAAKDGKADRGSAVNETLAEMANLDWQGMLPRLTWFKKSKSYKPFYEAIHKFYPQVKEADKFAAGGQFHKAEHRTRYQLQSMGFEELEHNPDKNQWTAKFKDLTAYISPDDNKWEARIGPNRDRIEGTGAASLADAVGKWKRGVTP